MEIPGIWHKIELKDAANSKKKEKLKGIEREFKVASWLKAVTGVKMTGSFNRTRLQGFSWCIT